MGISRHDRARIDAELDAEHEARSSRWATLAPALDPADVVSRDGWVSARQEFFESAGVDPGPPAARAKLAALKDRYRGERIFVLGNGPSLNRTALHHLENEFTFGVNRIYLMFERLSWRPTFYTTLDWRVAPDCLDEINSLDEMQLFFPERFRGLLRDGDDVVWYANSKSRHPYENGFASDAALGIRGAGSVSGAAIQLAFHMGFDPIYLIGCDVSYSVPSTVIQEGPDKFGTGVGLYLTSTKDDDANHFDKRYFGAGRRWHDPNVARMIQGFTQCRDGAARHGRTIENATVGGNLEVFPRVDFRSLFPSPDADPPSPSLAALSVAAAWSGVPGLMVDVGAGTGAHLAPFASLGWEIWAFEPSARQRSRLIAHAPSAWKLFVDPRALDAQEGRMPAHTVKSLAGVTLAAPVDGAAVVGEVVAADPARALELIGDQAPDVVAIDANDWEMEILSAWPFESSRPEFLIVAVDDRSSPRFGFDRRSVRAAMVDLGYEVTAIEDDEAFSTDESFVPPEAGGAVVLIGAPAGRFPPAMISAVSIASEALGALQPTYFDERDPAGVGARERIRRLETELEKLRSSTSWRIGRGLVQTLAPLKRVVRRAQSAVRAILRRLSP